MAKLTPQEFQAKQATRLKNALPEMRAGIQRVKEAPGVRAAAKQAKMRANLLDAIDNGTWARQVASVSLTDWQKDMMDKGVGRVATGIDGAANKVIAFAQKLNDYQDRLKQDIERMPDATPQDRINRMIAWTQGMANFQR